MRFRRSRHSTGFTAASAASFQSSGSGSAVGDSGHTGSDAMRAEALAATERFKMRAAG